MKYLVFLMALALSLNVFSREDDPKTDCGTKGIISSSDSFSDMAKINEAIIDTEMEMLGNKLCGSLELSFGYEDAGEKLENVILGHLGIDRKTPKYKDKILEIWNENSDKFICKSKSVTKPNLPTPQHFMKRVIDFNMEPQIFDEFLLYDSEEFPINVNAVEVKDGEKETVVDYLDKIINDPTKHKDYRLTVIKELREYLVEDYGAKKASELE